MVVHYQVSVIHADGVINNLVEKMLIVLMEPEIDIVVGWEFFLQFIIQHLFKGGILIQKQQDAFGM